MTSNNSGLNQALAWTLTATGALFSLLTVALIITNGQILRNIYARMMLIMQLSHLIACIIDIPKYQRDSSSCRLQGAFFYFFWLVANFMSELMLLLVILDLRKYRSSRCHRPFLFLFFGIVALSALLSFIPFEQYGKCEIGDQPLYCGICPDPDKSKVYYGMYIIPSVLGVVLGCGMVYQYIAVRKNDRLTVQQRSALKALFVPSVSVLFIIANAVLAISGFHISTEWDSVIVVLHQLVFLTPLVNHMFFAYFVTGLEEFSEIRIDRCRWMLLCCCCKSRRKGGFQDDGQLYRSSQQSYQRSDGY